MRIPIKAVREFGRKWGLQQVIVFASEKLQRGYRHHVATWGRAVAECGEAADFGNKLKDFLGWPESLHAQPARVRRMQKMIEDLQAENLLLKAEIMVKQLPPRPVDCVSTQATEKGEK